MGYHQFCLVDRDWSCRYGIFDLPANPETEMEDVHQPVCRSYDRYCSWLCGDFPCPAHGTHMAGFLYFPLSKHQGTALGEFQLTLFWDFIAITSYLLISFSFWYLGMLPDFATIRDRTKSKSEKLSMAFSPWDGPVHQRDWIRFDSLGFILGGIAAVLVVSVHSIVATDFAASIEPGWHTTIFPPYFVIGAIFSGFAMVMTLMVIMRKMYKLNDYITDDHMDAIARILIFISLIMGSSYMTEIFVAWYSNNISRCLLSSITWQRANIQFNSGPCSFAMPLCLSFSGLRS